MKKVFLFLFFLATVSSKAQTFVYHPFPDSGAVWMETIWWTFFGPPIIPVDNDYILFMDGDTIISGNNYKKLSSSGYWHPQGMPYDGANYYSDSCKGAFREDTVLKKVFYVPPYSSTETLLYDFNLNIGDTLPVTYSNHSSSVTVTSIDSVLMGSDYRKLIWLSMERESGMYAFIVEGMGASYGMLNDFVPWFESGSYLRCFSVNNQTLYSDTNFTCVFNVGFQELEKQNYSLVISPNPATNQFTISNKQFPIKEIEIHDVLGQRITNLASPEVSGPSHSGEGSASIDISELAPGIYFVRVLGENKSAVVKLVKQ